jgi:release factor glutamine methyltransferase
VTTSPDGTLAQVLAGAHARGVPRIDAQMLLLHALGHAPHDRAWLIAHDADALPVEAARRFETLVQRRLENEPVAYLTGVKEFFGLQLQVDARVLDPRPDTETLVAWALEVLGTRNDAAPDASGGPLGLVDLGTGSGAIALAVKHARPDVQVTAVDASAGALAVAQGNAARLRLPVRFIEGSWLRNVSGHYHVIVANPPYISAGDPHLAALIHEPLAALASGQDGLDDIRLIIRQAPAHLLPGGWLLLEHGWDQSESVHALLEEAGFTAVQSRSDLAGILRCTGGQWPQTLAPGSPNAAAPGGHGHKVK